MEWAECIVYDKMNDSCWSHAVLNIHLAHYTFAHQFIYNKRVLDAACGTCFGSMIFSTAAKSIVAVDRDKGAIEHGKKLPFFCPISFSVKNLEKDLLPEADICVSIETIEHLKPNGFFLKNLKTRELVFSVPLDGIDQTDDWQVGRTCSGKYHKILFKSGDEVAAYLRKNGWNPTVGMVNKRSMEGLFKDETALPKWGLINHWSVMGYAERMK